MGPYEETIRRWHSEGLPPDSDWSYYAGHDRLEWAPINFSLCPGFEYQKIKEDSRYEVYRDTDGVIKKKLKDQPPPGMPQYLEYPLKGRQGWSKFKKRLNPASPARFPVYWESIKKQYINRDFVLGLGSGSLYGWLRNWIGVEQISLLVYDDPAFLEEAAVDITECILGVIERALPGVEYDFFSFWEDMAYKTASLISPVHYRRIFLPQYRRIVDHLHKAGIDIIMMDSDGNVEELIPCWLDAGINLILPMEVAAGMDVVSLRKKFGKNLLMAGGMDKRILAADKPAIKRMVEEKIPLIQEGGYIPGCDHSIPPDVSFENYLYYRQVLSEIRF